METTKRTVSIVERVLGSLLIGAILPAVLYSHLQFSFPDAFTIPSVFLIALGGAGVVGGVMFGFLSLFDRNITQSQRVTISLCGCVAFALTLLGMFLFMQ